jgi:hypothetical protein
MRERVSEDAPAPAFRAIRLSFDLRAAAPPEQVAKLLHRLWTT